LKTFLTQIGPVLPLTPDPPVKCFWKWIGWKVYEVPKNRNLGSISAKKLIILLPDPHLTHPIYPCPAKSRALHMISYLRRTPVQLQPNPSPRVARTRLMQVNTYEPTSMISCRGCNCTCWLCSCDRRAAGLWWLALLGLRREATNQQLAPTISCSFALKAATSPLQGANLRSCGIN
jgi:hypothetical protein